MSKACGQSIEQFGRSLDFPKQSISKVDEANTTKTANLFSNFPDLNRSRKLEKDTHTKDTKLYDQKRPSEVNIINSPV